MDWWADVDGQEAVGVRKNLEKELTGLMAGMKKLDGRKD
jgi:hypothetical protein